MSVSCVVVLRKFMIQRLIRMHGWVVNRHAWVHMMRYSRRKYVPSTERVGSPGLHSAKFSDCESVSIRQGE